MPSRRTRHFTDGDVLLLLEQLRTFRAHLTQAQRQMPPTGEVYRSTGPLLEALDDFTGVLTGNRQYFWLDPPGTQRPSKE